MRAFTNLEVWKKSRLLRNAIFELTKTFPGEEKYRLADQIVRASRSIGNNIAESHGRYHYIDAAKFLINARGSAAEVIDHLIIAFDLTYIDKQTFIKLRDDCEECMKMINGYINFLKERKENNK